MKTRILAIAVFLVLAAGSAWLWLEFKSVSAARAGIPELYVCSVLWRDDRGGIQASAFVVGTYSKTQAEKLVAEYVKKQPNLLRVEKTSIEIVPESYIDTVYHGKHRGLLR